jgi:outer membrane murein-binding lipoprotein Lpp
MNKILTLVAAILAGVFMAGGASAAERPQVKLDRDADGFWKSDQARLLDSAQMTTALAAAAEQKLEKAVPADKTAEQILAVLLAEEKDVIGVHVETALAALGATAGFACQMAIRDGFIAKGMIAEDKAFVVIGTKSGETFYTGPLLNTCLTTTQKGQYSVWSLVAGAVQKLGAPIPDITPLFSESAGAMGSHTYGASRIKAPHQPNRRYEELLVKYWNVFRNRMVADGQDPTIWPLILAQAAQQLVFMAKDKLPPALSAEIVMDAAVAMSRLDPARVHEASLRE